MQYPEFSLTYKVTQRDYKAFLRNTINDVKPLMRERLKTWLFFPLFLIAIFIALVGIRMYVTHIFQGHVDFTVEWANKVAGDTFFIGVILGAIATLCLKRAVTSADIRTMAKIQDETADAILIGTPQTLSFQINQEMFSCPWPSVRKISARKNPVIIFSKTNKFIIPFSAFNLETQRMEFVASIEAVIAQNVTVATSPNATP